ncbi:MAG: 3,4-dihydroxy-2-butanone-4-phosphate synthase [Bdellovibrionales bacterium]|nr:3,4-dihydroxy-2-butanone-4-phosphate synthase [Bdellovibrionales bacterium]
MNSTKLSDIKDTFDARRPLVLLDDSSAPERAVLCLPAALCSPGPLNEMLELSGGGNVQCALSPARADAFMLEAMSNSRRTPGNHLAPVARELVSVEAREGVTTGISVSDRSKTLIELAVDCPQVNGIVKPGHVFPIRTREGGVLVRGSLAEAALDVCKLSGYSDACCLIDIHNAQGEYLSGSQLIEFISKYKLHYTTLHELVSFRLANEELVYRVADARMPNRFGGEMRSILFRSDIFQGDHLALVKGEITPESTVVVRVQPERTFEDVFGSLPNKDGINAGPRSIIDASLQSIGSAQCGVFVYLRRPDSGPVQRELLGELFSTPSKGAMMREFGLGAQILRNLGVRKISLLTASPSPLIGIDAYGLEILSYQPLFTQEKKT